MRESGDHPAVDHGALAALLAEQSGVVARRQLLGLGCRPHDIERLIRRRALTPVHAGVYVEHTGELRWHQRAWSAVLALWPAALWGESALHDETDEPGGDTPVHVAVERQRRLVAPPGLRVHRVVRFDERVLWNRSPPRVRYEDAVLEVASPAGSDFAAFAVLAEGCRTRRTTASRLAVTLAARPRVRRRAWLSGVLADLTAGSTSVLEHGYVTRVQRAHGLPRAAQQVRSTSSVGVVYRDVEYSGVLVVELDGRLVHNTAAQRDADFERDLDAALDGRATVRLSWGQVIDRPCTTASKISQLLQRHGWSGRPHSCSPGCRLTR